MKWTRIFEKTSQYRRGWYQIDDYLHKTLCNHASFVLFFPIFSLQLYSPALVTSEHMLRSIGAFFFTSETAPPAGPCPEMWLGSYIQSRLLPTGLGKTHKDNTEEEAVLRNTRKKEKRT